MAVIVVAETPAALAAKAATNRIPIVFAVGADPVQLGLVASLNRPGSNLTGFNSLVNEIGAKGLALLHELVPSAATIGLLENPDNPISELTTRDVLAAAPVIGLKVQTLKAGTDREIDAAFATPASPSTNPRWEGSGLSCSPRSLPGSSGPQSCSIPTRPPHRLICPHLRRRPGLSRSRQSLRPFIAT